MIEKIRNNPRLKQFVIGLISPHRHPRPRLWVRWFVNPFVHKKGRGALIRRHARLDVFPWRRFEVGRDALIEDYAVVNNGAGDVVIGDQARIGIGSVIIGPVRLGDRAGLGRTGPACLHLGVQPRLCRRDTRLECTGTRAQRGDDRT